LKGQAIIAQSKKLLPTGWKIINGNLKLAVSGIW